MKANIIFEMAKDGGCSCYMQEEIPDFGLLGFGDTPQEAKKDMLRAYEEIKELLEAEGKQPTQLEFIYHYMMRKYAAGIVKAGEGQYLKLQNAIHSIASELAAANF